MRSQARASPAPRSRAEAASAPATSLAIAEEMGARAGWAAPVDVIGTGNDEFEDDLS